MDEEILTALAHFQERIKDISLRFQKLRDITYDLYRENEELKEENENLKQLIFQDRKSDEEGYSNLLKLYNEGFHICHLNFGEQRDRDCLFCIQLVENKLEGEAQN